MTDEMPDALMNDLITYIEKAERLLKAGHMTELAGLNDAVDRLCARVLSLKPEISREYAPELEHLNTRLDDLQRAMVGAQKQIEENLEALNKRQRATKAYLTLTKPGE